MSEHSLSHAEREAALALLAWYGEAGIVAILQETPRDRFAETLALKAGRPAAAEGRGEARDETRAEAPQSRAAAGSPPAGREPPRERAPARIAVPDDAAVADARARAVSAGSLAELEAALHAFDGCALRITAKSTVFGSGAEAAEVMLVGEAPGREEDLAGVPFVGRSGRLLDRMLAAIGLERDAVRVTNTVPWRPPGNRPPTPMETQLCLPFLQRHIELVRPRIIVCLGSPSVKALLDTDEGILRLRGRWATYSFGEDLCESVPVMPMLHPAYLLRQPAQKRLAWTDLLAVKARLDETRRAVDA